MPPSPLGRNSQASPRHPTASSPYCHTAALAACCTGWVCRCAGMPYAPLPSPRFLKRRTIPTLGSRVAAAGTAPLGGCGNCPPFQSGRETMSQ